MAIVRARHGWGMPNESCSMDDAWVAAKETGSGDARFAKPSRAGGGDGAARSHYALAIQNDGVDLWHGVIGGRVCGGGISGLN